MGGDLSNLATPGFRHSPPPSPSNVMVAPTPPYAHADRNSPNIDEMTQSLIMWSSYRSVLDKAPGRLVQAGLMLFRLEDRPAKARA